MARRRTRTALTTTTAVLVLAVSGCAGGAGGAGATGAAAETQPGDSHTMADGSVMSGAEHGSDHAGEDGEAHGDDHQPTAAGPSETALMVCGGDVAADVQRLLGLDAPPESSYSWDEPVLECTYELASGPLVLTVHDATDAAQGEQWFETTRAGLAPTSAIKGVYSLGLPAFETGRGEAAFIREGKTLVVDASAMPAVMGAEGDMDQADLAYAVASSVLACWTDHG